VARPSWTRRLPERSSGSTSPLFPSKPEEGTFIIAHDDPGVRAADEVAAFLRCLRERFQLQPQTRRLLGRGLNRRGSSSSKKTGQAKAFDSASREEQLANERRMFLCRTGLPEILKTTLKTRNTGRRTGHASAIRRAFEAAGVELLDENGGGPAARLKRPISD
jgi:hypothetical protein